MIYRRKRVCIMPYHPFRLNLSRQQILNAVREKPVRVKHVNMNTGAHTIMLHPLNHKALVKAFNAGKGDTFILSPGEIHATKQSDMEGTGVFDFFKKGYNWIKNHWGTIKPILSKTLDVAVPIVSKFAPEAAPAIVGGRQLLKETTGVGIVEQQAQPPAKLMRKGRKKKSPKEAEGLYMSAKGLYM